MKKETPPLEKVRQFMASHPDTEYTSPGVMRALGYPRWNGSIYGALERLVETGEVTLLQEQRPRRYIATTSGRSRQVYLTEKQLAQRKGGRLLLDTEGKLRQFIEEMEQASPAYRNTAMNFWLKHLDIITQLTQEAVTEATGSSVDDLLDKIFNE